MASKQNEIRMADWEVQVASWDFDEAVKRARPLVFNWTAASVALFRELYLAREALSRAGGKWQRVEGEDVKTWSDFCAEIGYTRQAVNARLKNFVPAELSETGKDTFLIEEKPSKADREARSLVRIESFRRTGVYPDDWTEEDEELLRRIDAEEKAAACAHQAVENLLRYKRRYRPARDYFADMMSREGLREVSRFRLADKNLRSAQQLAGDSVAQFLYSIDDLNERAKAAANLVARLKDVINDSIEEAALAAAAEGAEDAEIIEEES